MTTHMDNASLDTSEQKEERHGLFRKQAVEKQQDRLLGDVLVIPPLSYSIITITLILFVTAAIVLLVNGSYARKETVQGLATQSDADAALEKVLSLKSQLQEITRTSDAHKITLETLQLQSSVLSFEQMDSEDQLQASLSAIAQSIAQLHGQQAYILKANSAGVVSNVQISEGQEALSNIPLMTLTPEGSELEAELLVPARAIGFVEKDQAVKIRYSAFSFQKFGLYDATITNVSQTVLLPNELTGLAVNAQEPMYRVTAKLAQQTIDAYGKPLSLKEGISLEADIKLAERTLLEWLFEPLFSLKGRL